MIYSNLNYSVFYYLYFINMSYLKKGYVPNLSIQHFISTHVHACVLSHFSCVQLFATLRTIANKAPLSIAFSRQECWSGLPRPPPGGLPDQGKEPKPLEPPALTGRLFTASTTWEVH